MERENYNNNKELITPPNATTNEFLPQGHLSPWGFLSSSIRRSNGDKKHLLLIIK